LKRLFASIVVVGLCAGLVLFGVLPGEAARAERIAAAGKKGKPAAKVRWIPYDEGLRRGKREGKKIFLNFYADWCHYCQVMEEKTFQDSAVAAFLNDYYIPIQVDSDRQRKIAKEYRVQGLPTTFFLAEDGDSIGSQPGYIPPDVMLPLLKFIHTDSFKKMDFKKFKEGR
jgi:thiol:disulfide interchange protein